MEPIPETVEVLRDLDGASGAGSLLDRLCGLADRAQAVVPDLVGVSIARQQEGLSFTLVATDRDIAVLDAVQYVAGGPCVDSAEAEEVREFSNVDPLDEERWQMFAQATAARAVRSTLTLPVVVDAPVVGTVNLYAASRRAFVGQHERLAEIFGALAAGAVSNADLAFTTRAEAEAAPGRVRDQMLVDVAVGLLAAQLEVDTHDAEERLHEAAVRAGVSPVELARHIVELQEGSDGDGGSV
ncbi:ANTAR domain-containing protein [Nocardioides sp. SYSU D00065]|uniref:ANTAR domain-containing protein n=1 Tax=Nocardioides sp. SYSU D00065 TaxID=2817378 RepID=UPI001FEF5531|nr:GAF domain-containing protein [Nocardioides sp. SYSU D00065]